MERIIVTLVAVVLMVLDANNIIKIPEQAITMITGLYLVGDSTVRSAKAIAISKLPEQPTGVETLSIDSDRDRFQSIKRL